MQQPSIGLRQLEHLGGFEPSILNRPELANRWAQKSGRKVRFFDSTEGVSAFGTSISTPKGVSEAPNFPFKTKGLPIDGGGGGSRTRVRRRLTPGTTCLARR